MTIRPFKGALERDACGIGFVADVHGRATRSILDTALGALACLRHRGALSADAKTGDGAGILLPLSPALLGQGRGEPEGRANGAAMVFLSTDEIEAAAGRGAITTACADEDIEIIGWREVPTDDSVIGALAQRSRPTIYQMLVRRADAGTEAAEQAALRARRRAQLAMAGRGRFYVASFSFRTIVFKGLIAADRLAHFYTDLASPDAEVGFAIFHQRFSTNTLPTWERAQPFRFLCHNGEINAIDGNERRMAARHRLGTEDVKLGPDEIFRPVLDSEYSDSGKLDSAIELLVRGGRSLTHALAMVIPEAWEGMRDVSAPVRDFYRYHACLMEPWDGPAGLCLTDGVVVAAGLDRNGLRPLRWLHCEDGLVVVASEVGAVDVNGRGEVRRGRLGPGQLLCVDPVDGRLLLDAEIKAGLAHRAPYGEWVDAGLWDLGPGKAVTETRGETVLRQVAFGHTQEETALIVKAMAFDAKEPVFSMGDDTPIPPLASAPRPVHHFVRQRFAQVTNPPIDHLRERLVMSNRTLLGPREPVLCETQAAAALIEMPSFFLYPSSIDALFPAHGDGPFDPVRLDATFGVSGGSLALAQRLRELADEAAAAVANGSGLLLISDTGIGSERAPVPVLLAVGAVHQRLVRDQTRTLCSIVVDTDEVRDVHHFCSLLGFGADAICPRLALEGIVELIDAPVRDDDEDESGEMTLTSAAGQENYQAAVEDGVLKVLSKMGICTVDSYRGAQLFEVVGLDAEVVDLCLTGTPTCADGVGFAELGDHALARHFEAYAGSKPTRPGIFRHRRGGEYHANNPTVFKALHAATLTSNSGVRSSAPGKAAGANGGTGPGLAAAPRTPAPVAVVTREMRAAHLLQKAVASGDYAIYEQFAALVNDRPPTVLHDLLAPVAAAQPVPLDEVEPVLAICTRFSTGAMSHGSISAEAHETLAIAMNMIGGRSNCGEGGEDPYRYRTRGSEQDRNSRIKQIASGRFGVTPEYCIFADELNIKMAQGSKPGEGGQLPGHKVTDEIARLRHTQPGVPLISPPPHHDIYSIEDLAQLIYDLKQVNPGADVSVKLVAEAGVGTIAAGVVKALADIVQISGADGGTGASALSSIKHAGLPWEAGLAETQRVLADEGLRSRVRLRVDGGFKTGRDVIVAALLGADEFSFGTAALLAEGCIMARACHKDTCQVGIATQRPHLRAKYQGTPDGVATYMVQVAEEVRRALARLGLRSLDEAIGRTDLLRRRAFPSLPAAGEDGAPSPAALTPSIAAAAERIDLSDLLVLPAGIDAEQRRFVGGHPIQRPNSELGHRFLGDAYRALWEGDHVALSYEIANSDRTFGAELGGAVALEWGEAPPPGSAHVTLAGSAGQSFGAFLTAGIELSLTGDANDYVGKGMGGGRIVIRPPAGDAGQPYLLGNTALYGATGGELLVAGRAGERFAVRNSGASAVVEGVGHHGCEYMTGGTIVILGPVGYNFGAGMTGGEAFVHDPLSRLEGRLNRGLVGLVRPRIADLTRLRRMLDRHSELTGSETAIELTANWDDAVDSFWRVLPLREVARIESTQETTVGAAV